jgi:hypothetical protein
MRRFWLQQRCNMLLQSQQSMRPTADTTWTVWRTVFDQSDTCHQVRAELNFRDRLHGRRSMTVSLVVSQLHSVLNVSGQSNVVKYVADMLKAIPTPAAAEGSAAPPPAPCMAAGTGTGLSAPLDLTASACGRCELNVIEQQEVAEPLALPSLDLALEVEIIAVQVRRRLLAGHLVWCCHHPSPLRSATSSNWNREIAIQ